MSVNKRFDSWFLRCNPAVFKRATSPCSPIIMSHVWSCFPRSVSYGKRSQHSWSWQN